MATLLYFAYGSNMLQERLVTRVSSARSVGQALLRGYQLDFAKKSIDLSGKGDMLPSAGGEVWGRLFEFDEVQKPDLDEHEGPGYLTHEVVVSTDTGARQALTYLADPARRDLAKVPYDWYLALIVAGARQGKLPEAYIHSLEDTVFDIDPDVDRRTRLKALDALTDARMSQVLDDLQQRMIGATGG